MGRLKQAYPTDYSDLTPDQVERLKQIQQFISDHPQGYGRYGNGWFALKGVLQKRDPHFPYRSEPDPHALTHFQEFDENNNKTGDWDDGDIIDWCSDYSEKNDGMVSHNYRRKIYYPEHKSWGEQEIEMCDPDIGYTQNFLDKTQTED